MACVVNSGNSVPPEFGKRADSFETVIMSDAKEQLKNGKRKNKSDRRKYLEKKYLEKLVRELKMLTDSELLRLHFQECQMEMEICTQEDVDQNEPNLDGLNEIVENFSQSKIN